MKKVVVGILLLFSMFCYSTNVGQAQTVPVSVTFPQGTLTVQISKIIAQPPFNGTTDTWPPAGTPSEGSLSFGQLVELRNPSTNAPLGVFGPSDNRYYALDIAVSGGGLPTSISVQIAWTGADAAILGPHISATYKQMTFTSVTTNPTESTLSGPQPISQAFRNLTITDFTGGHWIRMYVGVFVPPATGTSPAGLTPFTSGDAARGYNASLSITVL